MRLFRPLLRLAFLSAIANAVPEPKAQAVSIARWKGDAAAAYTVTMDDFCADHITGIQAYADTMFHNRGMTMGFGALVGQCDENDWRIAARMIGHGHELMNHTWTHGCGKAGLEWCKPYWGEDKNALEIDQAGKTAENRLGIKVRFFIFPYDEWDLSKIDYLRQKGYLGARTGIKGALTPHDFRDGFNLNFDVNWPRGDAKRWEQQRYTLNGYIDEAVAKGGWAIRETHGVNDSSWGYLLDPELREHLDYAKAKVDLGLLWVSGPSAVLKYKQARDAYRATVTAETERLIVQFNAAGLDTSIYDASLTLTLSIPANFASGFLVYQQGRSIPFTRKTDGSIRFDAHPHRGAVVVTANPLLASSLRGPRAGNQPDIAFSPRTGKIHYHLDAAGEFSLDLVSPEGRRLRTLARGRRGPGLHVLELDRRELRPGIYFLRLKKAGRSESAIILLLP